jgi:hypothetical protein
MADYMFPNDTTPLPAGLFDAFAGGDPGPFIGAMESGMQSFAAAFEGGGMAAAGDAFMSTMHDHCAAGDVPGMTPETFDTFADAFTEIAGPGLMTMPADASAADMAEVFQDAAEVMMPEGMEIFPEMGDMFGNMADVCDGLDDCGPHELGEEFGPEMPEGFVPGDPSTLPEGDFAPPLGVDSAALDPNAPPGVDPTEAAPLDPNAPPGVDPAAAAPLDPNAPPGVDPAAAAPLDPNAPPGVDPAALDPGDPAAVLGEAIGGEADAAGAGLDGEEHDHDHNAADTAIGAAMDSATDQGLAEGQPDDARPVDAPDDVVVVEDVPEDDAAPDDVSPV